MGNRIDKTVMLLAAAKLPHQKNRIDHHACDDKGKKDDAEKQQHALAPVENDPADIQGNGQRYQTNPQAEKENDGSATARDAHGVLAPILPRSRPPVGKAPSAAASTETIAPRRQHGKHSEKTGMWFVGWTDVAAI